MTIKPAKLRNLLHSNKDKFEHGIQKYECIWDTPKHNTKCKNGHLLDLVTSDPFYENHPNVKRDARKEKVAVLGPECIECGDEIFDKVELYDDEKEDYIE